MTQEITMGSLFSGSGGFELAGSIFGIRPIWASEIGKSQEGGKNQWQKRIKASVCFLKWDVERR
jgi:hypothetical protein